MKKKTLLSIMLLLLTGILISSPLLPTKKWHKGMIVLKNDQIIEGKIQYNYKYDLVQCDNNGLIYTYSPQKVELFAFLDNNLKSERVFKSISHKGRNGYRSLKFFEVLDVGDLPLMGLLKFVGKKAVGKRGKNTSNGQRKQSVREFDYKLIYEYYVLCEGKLVSVENFGKNVMPLMKENEEAITDYITENNLNIEYSLHQLKLVEYYNSIASNSGVKMADNQNSASK